jgi:hypothetical protein
MPFFLLSRDDDDQLRLLAPTASPSRQDALAVLAQMTADPAFDGWDDEVLLVDIDSALPVLVVRPSEAAPSGEPRVVSVELDEVQELPDPAGDVSFVWPAVPELQPDSESSDTPDSVSEIPDVEAQAFAAYVSAAEEDDMRVVTTLSTEMIDEEPAAEEVMPVPELAMELEPESSIDTEILGEYSPTNDLTETKSYELRDALARTTAAMEIEALAQTPQESAVPPVPELEPMIDRWPWEVAAVAPVEAVAMPLGATVEPEVEVDVAPESIEVAEVVPVVFEDADILDTEPLKPSAFLDDLEPIPSTFDSTSVESEPTATPDVEPPMVLQPDSLVVSEPEPDSQPAAVPSVELEPDAAPIVELEPEMEPVVEPEPEMEPLVEPEPEPEPEAPETPVPASSEPAVPQPTAPAGYEPVTDSASMDSYVCDDCVYVGTCPNKDQRVPKDCGSFQWK